MTSSDAAETQFPLTCTARGGFVRFFRDMNSICYLVLFLVDLNMPRASGAWPPMGPEKGSL